MSESNMHHTFLQSVPFPAKPAKPSLQSICLGCDWKGRVYRNGLKAMAEGDDHSLFRVRQSLKHLIGVHAHCQQEAASV